MMQQVNQGLFGRNLVNEDELCNFQLRNKFDSIPSQRDFNLDDEEVVQVNAGYEPQISQLKTGRFAGGQQSIQNSSPTLDQFKNNNDQISQLLQQLQVPSFGFQPPNIATSQVSLSDLYLPLKDKKRITPSYNYVHEEPRGITHNQLNQDNSLLALAQRKPLGSSSGTNQMEESPLDNDFFFKESQWNQQECSSAIKQSRKQSAIEEHGKENNYNHANQYHKQNSTKIENSFNYFTEQSDKKKLNTNFYSRLQSDNDLKRKELMHNYDEIPIKDFNKKTEEFNNTQDDDLEKDENNMTLVEKVDHPKWKVRMKAYKQISELFYNEYSMQCQKKNGTQESQIATEEDQEGEKVFETYGPLMQKIIGDSNLTAQYEGLNCLFAYMRFSPEIRAVSFQVHSILLDKVQLNKPTFKEITMKILMCILRRDRATSVLPELLRRFKNKNSKVATFAMEVILEALKNQLLIDEQNLKTIFKVTSDNLAQSNKELRDMATDLLKEIYKMTEDDASAFVRNLKQLRPVQLKDIKDMLQEVEKSQKDLVQLFSPNQQEAQSYTEGFSKKTAKEDQEQDEEGNQTENEQDLTMLLPDNFAEIPYVSQINVKKKGMETFNQELEKLILRKQPAVYKDYSSIFNVVVHILEDSNALVFMEAIKNVEYLCILLGKSMKSQKIRQFMALLTDKYKETKTAVIAAVNKTLSVIVQTQTLPVSQIIDYLIVQVAHSHKNPRVKQLILEKVDCILKEEPLKEEERLSIFKQCKDKILGFIQKDTNAGVRDAAVAMLTTFKMLLLNSPIVTEAVNTLPKYRVAEINKRVQELGEPVQQQVRAQSAKQASSKQVLQPKKEVPTDANDFSYQGRNISGQYQIHLAEIILLLKKMKQCNFPDPSVFQDKCDEVIEKLGEQGVYEAKPVITSCVHWLLTSFLQKSFPDAEILNILLNLLKKIYCIQRSIEFDQESSMISKELKETLMVVMLSVIWNDNLKQTENLMNVLISAAGSAHTFLENLISQLQTIKGLFNIQQILRVLGFTFAWVENKLDNLLSKGMSLNDFEDLRSVGLSFMNDNQSQEVQDQIIQIIVKFKNSLNHKKKEMELMEQSSIHHQEDQDEEEKGEVKKILQSMPSLPAKPTFPVKLSKGQEIVEMMEQSFEKGLLMIKELAHSEEASDPQTKELVFQKLLSMVVNVCKNPQQQYQQAYSLKALMWFKEEVLGLEDCFKYCDAILKAFAYKHLEGIDSSVEVYLLNHWVKELSLRDLIDRLSYSCSQDSRNFEPLFKWLMNHSLNAANEDQKWSIEDFRKVSLLLAKNIKLEEVREFFQQAVDKFGQSKVREFMEIQLMHSPSEYNMFMDWFTLQFKSLSQPDQSKLQLPSIQKGSKKFEVDSELQSALKQPPAQSLHDESASSSRNKNIPQHSSYHQRRDKRKTSAQRKHEDEGKSSHKYENIITRLESQLHLVKDTSNQKPQTTTSSSNFQSNRYDTAKTEEDEAHQEQQIEEAQKMLMDSQVKENKYKDELQRLEEERYRIEKEKEMLMKEKNKGTDEWKHKFEFMKEQHEEVIESLKEANKCYLTQVNENEDLKKQLRIMQEQHIMMMKKFEEIENKLSLKQEQKKQNTPSQNDTVMMASITKTPINQQTTKQPSVQIVTEQNLQKIEQVFTNENGQVMSYQSESQIGIKKIQELLLNSDKEDIGLPLFFYYSKIKSISERKTMIAGLNEALNHEDVLYALSNETYKVILHFLLKVFALEKAKIEEQAITKSISSFTGTTEQNDVTIEVQKIVSKLLNSKEFTTSLVTLFQILKVTIPADITLELTEEQKQLLKVIMRCVSRITKALHSEHPDLIRAFDVLIEMHKIFTLHPPEQLREDLPSLQDFDYVYRTLKDVSDKLMELQPGKVLSFLKFVNEQAPNAFTKYMSQMMQVKYQDTETHSDYMGEDY